MEISVDVVRDLLVEQFPEWADLPIRAVTPQGNDNRSFRLGEKLLVRLPSAEGYVPQVAREEKWLPYLAHRLPLPIPEVVASGCASQTFPFPWSVRRYLVGEVAAVAEVADEMQFAEDLGGFLHTLQCVDATDGPLAGSENCFRGCEVTVYQGETYQCLSDLSDDLPTEKLRLLWEEGSSTLWTRHPVWLHGDVNPMNLLVNSGRLSAVIDFGIMAVGDPACDLVIAWTFFGKRARQVFFEAVGADTETIWRGRCWAIWKALIDWDSEHPYFREQARHTIAAILDESGEEPQSGYVS